MPRASQSRFRIRGEDGELSFSKYTDATQTLSRALDIASRVDTPGTWEVIEWEDVVYRVHKLDNPENKLDIRVEVVR